MKEIITKYRLFYILFSLFFIAGIITLTQINKGDLILFFSENRTQFWDSFFKITTQFGEEIAYLVIGITFLFIQFRKAIIIGLTGLLVMGISYGLKMFFSHPRPSVFFHSNGQLPHINLVEDLKLLSGPTSFPSGHTMSGFAMYLLVMLFLPAKKRYAIICFMMALVVGISRIYLVQHFLQDVLAGAFCGVLVGTAVFYYNQKYPSNPNFWIDQSLLNLKKKSQNPNA